MITAKEARGLSSRNKEAINDHLREIEKGIRKTVLEDHENDIFQYHDIPHKDFGPPLISELTRLGYHAKMINDFCLSVCWSEKPPKYMES